MREMFAGEIMNANHLSKYWQMNIYRMPYNALNFYYLWLCIYYMFDYCKEFPPLGNFHFFLFYNIEFTLKYRILVKTLFHVKVKTDLYKVII